MKILIINGYPRTLKGLHAFDEFHWAIKKVSNPNFSPPNFSQNFKILTEQKEFIDIETEYITREKDNLDDFLYEPDSGYAKTESGKLFDHLDMIFICGDPYLLPWHHSAQKVFYFCLEICETLIIYLFFGGQLVLLIRMCLRVNKIVFLSSFAMRALIFLCATNFEKVIFLNFYNINYKIPKFQKRA